MKGWLKRYIWPHLILIFCEKNWWKILLACATNNFDFRILHPDINKLECLSNLSYFNNYTKGKNLSERYTKMLQLKVWIIDYPVNIEKHAGLLQKAWLFKLPELKVLYHWPLKFYLIESKQKVDGSWRKIRKRVSETKKKLQIGVFPKNNCQTFPAIFYHFSRRF